tara:strand:- start:1849 stop:2175 length:327 start_codon:yes stop_codon:yes gene_type:complete
MSKNKPIMSKNKPIVCADGFTMSVQANAYAYCNPRIDSAEKYTEAEVGYPSEEEPLLLNWAENPERPTNTVYPYVPSDRITLVCAKHGGIVEGDLPNGIAYLAASNLK